jgi:Protein of unknown function (DUF3307)
MTWTELLTALFIGHLVGDLVLQTEQQAINKAGGLSGDPRAARALAAHMVGYVLAMVPAAIWVASAGAGSVAALVMLAAIAIPHAIQDDRRLLVAYARRVKGMDPDREPLVMFGLDQAFHALTLCLTALVFTL